MEYIYLDYDSIQPQSLNYYLYETSCFHIRFSSQFTRNIIDTQEPHSITFYFKSTTSDKIVWAMYSIYFMSIAQ